MVVVKTKILSKEQQADLYEIGNRIREAREDAKMTQNDLADLLECDRATISHYEGGTGGYVGGARLYKLCDVLNLTPNDLSPTRYQKKEAGTEEQIIIDLLAKLPPEKKEILLPGIVAMLQTAV